MGEARALFWGLKTQRALTQLSRSWDEHNAAAAKARLDSLEA